jgi:hypothetical protein
MKYSPTKASPTKAAPTKGSPTRACHRTATERYADPRVDLVCCVGSYNAGRVRADCTPKTIPYPGRYVDRTLVLETTFTSDASHLETAREGSLRTALVGRLATASVWLE